MVICKILDSIITNRPGSYFATQNRLRLCLYFRKIQLWTTQIQASIRVAQEDMAAFFAAHHRASMMRSAQRRSFWSLWSLDTDDLSAALSSPILLESNGKFRDPVTLQDTRTKTWLHDTGKMMYEVVPPAWSVSDIGKWIWGDQPLHTPHQMYCERACALGKIPVLDSS